MDQLAEDHEHQQPEDPFAPIAPSVTGALTLSARPQGMTLRR
ncbi:MAG: hypothetical protein SGJ07_08240 [Rhodospirillaceae bacterium]|nr:hypothetical protein [Rhodospirillaceae bacterium]